jgi:hypothetical protein
MVSIRTRSDITIRGADTVSTKFERMSRRAKYISPEAWEEVGTYLSGIEAEQFATEGARLGTPWQPLAPSTIRDRLKHGFMPGPILIRTGDLAEQFIDRPMALERYYKHSAYFGSKIKKSIWQHKGTFYKGKRHIPPRPIMVVTEETASHVAHILGEYIVHG